MRQRGPITALVAAQLLTFAQQVQGPEIKAGDVLPTEPEPPEPVLFEQTKSGGQMSARNQRRLAKKGRK